MANTREIMGEQACLDALVANTLTSFEDDGVTKVGYRGLYYRTALTGVTLPNCKSIDDGGFANCTGLEVVDIEGTGTISAAFSGARNLTHLIMRGSTKTVLSDAGVFNSTPITLGDGAIYVDEDLLSAYKADANWNRYVITTLDKYPLSDFSTITESWAELDAMTQEQIAAKYAIGDSKLVDLGTEGKVYAQIAGIGVDDLASSGKAKVTFIIRSVLETYKRMNPASNAGAQGTGTSGGWEYSEMRSYLNTDVFALLPSELQTAIKSVTKYSDHVAPGSVISHTHDHTTTDKLWLPSAREVFGGTSYEQTGPVYSGLFFDNGTRIRRRRVASSGQNINAGAWWLRSPVSSNMNFRCVAASGNLTANGSTNNYGVVIGFCI